MTGADFDRPTHDAGAAQDLASDFMALKQAQQLALESQQPKESQENLDTIDSLDKPDAIWTHYDDIDVPHRSKEEVWDGRKKLFDLVMDEYMELPGRPHVVYQLKDYTKISEGVKEVRDKVDHMTKKVDQPPLIVAPSPFRTRS